MTILSKIFAWCRTHKRRSLLIFAILLLAIGYIFFHGKSNMPDMPVKRVEITVLKKQDIQQTIRLLGVIHPKHSTVLVAKGNGLLDVLITSGMAIKKDDLIAKIDNPQVENNLKLATLTETLAEGQYNRISPHAKTGFVSLKDIDEKKQALLDAQKEVSKAKIELDNLRFYAPFDGIVGAFKKREGAEVKVGDAVVVIYDPTSLTVDFNVPCSNLTDINANQALYFKNKRYTLSHFQKMLDEETHMCPADADIVCPQCLIGSTVAVDLVVKEHKNTLVIPFQALIIKNGQTFVYTVEQSKVAMKPVETGLKQQDSIEVTKGLKAYDKLIIKGQERLYPDMPVDIS